MWPGVYDERVFRALDWVMCEAGRRGLKLVLGLTNFWSDYGGMGQYVKWSRASEAGGQECGGGNAVRVQQFYGDAACQQMFQAFVKEVVLRKNSLSGVIYR